MRPRLPVIASAVALFILALFVRLILLGAYLPVSPWVGAQTLADAEMGRNLLEGRGWTANPQLLERANAAQREPARRTLVDLQDLLPVNDANADELLLVGSAHSPGYSTWFAVSYWLGGSYRYVHSQRMQAVLDALAAVLVFGIGVTCWSIGAGLVGGVLYAFSPPHAFLANLTVAAATDSFWFLLTAFGAVRTAVAVMRGGSPVKGGVLIALAGFFGACMNSTSLVLPTITAGIAILIAIAQRRYWRVVATLLVAQVVVFAALTPWALRNQRLFDQFSLVRGSFWQLAFAAWGELPNPWGLGFDDKEYWHWIDENCPGCSAGGQQAAMRDFLLQDVVTSPPFPRHVANLLTLRVPRLIEVARTPEGVLAPDSPRWIATWFSRWDRALPVIAVLAALGLIVALVNRRSRALVMIGIAPTVFLTAFSLLFYVELRKTVPGYGFMLVLAGIAIASSIEGGWRLAAAAGKRQAALGVTALLLLCTQQPGDAQAPAIVGGGELHSEVVTAQGDVWGFGNDLYGQLGNGRRLGRYAAERKAQADGMTDVAAIAVGSNHSLAIKRDGTVWAWGDGSLGQLGDGNRTTALTPRRVAMPMAMASIAGGYVHSLALDREGHVWAWGNNLYGQLGVPDIGEALSPVRVEIPGRVTSIAAGWFSSFAVDDAGHVWSWGHNERGQLGLGSMQMMARPTRVPTLAEIRSVAAGHHHALALTRAGQLWGWGANDYGQVGVPRADGQLPSSNTFDMLELMKQNAARGQRPAVTARSYAGRTELTPRPIAQVPATAHLSAAADSSFALTSDGRVWAWGDNLYGQLGDGTFATRSAPAPVQALPRITALGAGHAHAVAIASDATLWAWGFGHYGQLGDGLTERRSSTPRKIQNLRVREPILDLSPGNALSINATNIGWLEPGVTAADGNRLVIKGTAAGRYTYAALAKPQQVGGAGPFKTLFVQGTVRTGGLTIGVQVDQQWVYQINVSEGPFTVLWDAPQAISAVAVIAHDLPEGSLFSDAVIDAWGWLKSLPAPTR